ncbi:MAG TPA: tetratricopeptide repeat protein [Bacteroidia bacterium]|jgi:tetratricopeptide (TPR) repeat protein|nr:tetratricopeptide repeat protein [Bacteroidia bacterium]
MKKISLVVLSLSFAFAANAQNLQDAITNTENECFETAAANFRSLIAKEPGKGDYYFYYGENFYKNNNPDSALIIYKKGTEIQATNALNYIGVGKVLLGQGNDKEANTNLFKAKTLGVKNATALMKLAEVYINVADLYKNLTEANKLLTDAIKAEPKNPEAHLLMGDCLLEQMPTDGSLAVKEYDKALELNSKSAKGILRKGKLYGRGRNYNIALDFYKQAITADPKFAPAYMEMAELYHLAGQPAKALENIKKYLEIHCPGISAKKRYASFQFLNKQYPDAIKEVEEIVKTETKDCFMWRILGWSYFEMGNGIDKDAYTKGVDAMNKFFNCTSGANFKILPDDYKYLGLLLGKTGKDSLGADAIVKAIALDSVKNCELYGTIGQIFFKAKKWDKVVYNYERKALCPGKGLTGQDNFDLGRAYFYLAAAKIKEASEKKDMKEKQKKEAEATPLFVKADTAFSKLCQASPNFPTGYFWRGKASINIDPKNELFLAKPHFEKALSLVKPEERALPTNKDNVIIACEYLGYYYLKMKDNVKAKEYWTIVQTLDPNNEKAKAFFKSPEGK